MPYYFHRAIVSQAIILAAWVGLSAFNVSAYTISGVGNGALDLPRATAAFFLPGSSDPLETGSDLGDLGDLFPGLDDLLGVSSFSVEGFTDTGAGTVLIGGFTADSYGIPLQDDVAFADVGIGGIETFGVTELLDVRLIPSTPSAGGGDIANYSLFTPNVRGSVSSGPEATSDPIDQIIASYSEFNVFGMPLLDEKTMVIDHRGMQQFVLGGGVVDENSIPQLVTHIYDNNTSNPTFNKSNPDSTNPGVPTWADMDLIIDLEFASFSGLTTTSSPLGTNPNPMAPSLAHNPMIGGGLPAHLNETVDDRDNLPGISIALGSNTSTGQYLFDTGGSVTIISEEQALALGIQYRTGAGPESGSPILEDAITGDARLDQFTVQVGGVGGTITLAGIFLDEMVVPAYRLVDGVEVAEDLIIEQVPVFIADISIADPQSPGGIYTLPGVFGMNNLFATSFIDGAIDPTGVDLTLIPGAFDWIVYDETTNRFGLIFAETIPTPGSLAYLMSCLFLLGCRTRKRAAC